LPQSYRELHRGERLRIRNWLLYFSKPLGSETITGDVREWIVTQLLNHRSGPER